LSYQCVMPVLAGDKHCKGYRGGDNGSPGLPAWNDTLSA